MKSPQTTVANLIFHLHKCVPFLLFTFGNRQIHNPYYKFGLKITSQNHVLNKPIIIEQIVM